MYIYICIQIFIRTYLYIFKCICVRACFVVTTLIDLEWPGLIWVWLNSTLNRVLDLKLLKFVKIMEAVPTCFPHLHHGSLLTAGEWMMWDAQVLDVSKQG